MTDLKKLREKSIALAKKNIRESVSEDNFIIHSINNIDELVTITNSLTKRLRHWYAICLPEYSRLVTDNEAFVRLILTKNRKEQLQELKIKESMGVELSKKDLEPIINLASKISSLYELRDELTIYIEGVLSKYCKNTFVVAGGLMSARLIKEAGSLRKLAMMTSSTVQLLGAEKALFRHLKTGARSPKHGLILHHPLVSSAKRDKRGKCARALADKLSIAVKTDYFKGKFIGDKLKAELEEKLK